LCQVFVCAVASNQETAASAGLLLLLQLPPASEVAVRACGGQQAAVIL